MEVSELAAVKELHHAYVVVGPSTGSGQAVFEMLKKRGVGVSGNPDVLSLTFTDLLVDDARMITERAFLKSVGDAKYFIVTFGRAGNEAQNALLKVVEESPGATHFFFCVDSPGFLIPTLRSRCIEIGGAPQEKEDLKDAEHFMKLGYAERLEAVEKLVSASQKSQDRSEVRSFVRDLTKVGEGAKLPASALRALLTADSQLRLTGGSPKLVLSHLAVTLPQV